MQIPGQPNPYQAPSTPDDQKDPNKEPILKTIKRGLAIGTLLSAPVITIGTTVDEYQDGKPATLQSISSHLASWSKKIAPNGFSFGMGAAAVTRNRKKDDQENDETKPQQ